MEIQIKSPNGVKLLTNKKYCAEDIDVIPALQDKTVTPTDTTQTVTPDANYAGLKSVTVEPGTVTADATATADDIRLGKTAYGADGKMTGTIADYDGSSEPTSGKSLFAQLVDGTITEVTADDLKDINNIRSHVFSYSFRLSTVSISDDIRYIQNDAFHSCSNLTTIMISNSVTHIGRSAFQGCSSLTSILIPNSISVIDDHVLSECTKLTNVIMGNNVTTIKNNAFSGCRSLTSITIPDSVTSIGDYVWWLCSSLSSIIIPNNVISLGSYVFSDCSKLANITIGKSVTSINTWAFHNNGTDIASGTIYTILATTPPTIQSGTFDKAKINKIIVPVGTSAAYKAATNWSALADKIEEATE